MAGFSISHWSILKETPSLPIDEPSHTAVSAATASVEVKIPAPYLASANIAVEPVIIGKVGMDILVPAVVTSPPGGEASVVARASGTVIRVNYLLGDMVRAGDVLALIDSFEAASMSADRSVAMAKVELARKSYAREISLYQQGVTPRQDMEAAKATLTVAEAEVRRATAVAQAAHISDNGNSVAVVSPINGNITTEMATLGAFVEPQAELFRIANSKAVQVEASVTAADSRRITAGNPAAIISATGSPLSAVVHSVTPTVNGSTQTATVVLKLNEFQSLTVGEGVQVRLQTHEDERDGLSVPEDAVQNLNGRDVLFVRTAEGFRAQPVLIGVRSGSRAQIVSGIGAGEQVATRNAFLVKAEMNKGAEEEE
ncbi:efflux RND transporter periplasmic adaptor subunit [Azomonas macrocytogenes]|uniref:Cobalt-zinc-cadmium efflux system membrane fusion protein n=1 Tax=Azomonas macrocytogenes TaxID=69962 RepID=A0A839TAM3_AZOMA|nr:efflux RND transporter periplasmic adaptor subunit [Azomonas macrocytogenes]MBB3105085.1 cobalt-zinc-cadmium efflux system membrane fusion protein [Azomonas macrocytogenes]